MLSICQWIYLTPLSLSIRESIWVYPILNVLHCVGILLVAGTIVVVDLRLLGFGLRRSPVSSVVRASAALDAFRLRLHVRHRIAARVVGTGAALSQPVLPLETFVPRDGRPQRAALSLRHLSRSRRVGHGFAHTRPRASGRRRVHRLLDLRDRRRTRGWLRARYETA